MIFGEALALLVGMIFLSGSENSWLSYKNNVVIALDLFAGAVLIHLAAQGNLDPIDVIVFWGSVHLTFAAHLYREWEYLAKLANAFCANVPLFVLNNVKLIGLVLVFVIGTSA